MPGPVPDARAFPVPIPKVCTSCRTNIHVDLLLTPQKTSGVRNAIKAAVALRG